MMSAEKLISCTARAYTVLQILPQSIISHLGAVLSMQYTCRRHHIPMECTCRILQAATGLTRPSRSIASFRQKHELQSGELNSKQPGAAAASVLQSLTRVAMSQKLLRCCAMRVLSCQGAIRLQLCVAHVMLRLQSQSPGCAESLFWARQRNQRPTSDSGGCYAPSIHPGAACQACPMVLVVQEALQHGQRRQCIVPSRVVLHEIR